MPVGSKDIGRHDPANLPVGRDQRGEPVVLLSTPKYYEK
jgi:hypothetical protein